LVLHTLAQATPRCGECSMKRLFSSATIVKTLASREYASVTLLVQV
jgi:hypothetical protein